MKRHWIEKLILNKKSCEMFRDVLSEEDSQRIKQKGVTRNCKDNVRFYIGDQCVGFRLFDAEAKGREKLCPVRNAEGMIEWKIQPEREHENETSWTYFKDKLVETKKKGIWTPPISENDKLI